MALALLLLWNDIEAARTDEYERWHTLEHVPERVWAPGFVSGSRYVSTDGRFSKYFTVYELQDLESLSTPEYRSLVEQPTPWSASMRPSFSGFLRKTGPVVASAGVSLGSVASAIRLVWNAAIEPSQPVLQLLAERILLAGVSHHMSRCRFMKVATAGPQAMSNVDAAPAGREYICIVEGFRPGATSQLAPAVRAALEAQGVAAPIWTHESHYSLSSSVRHADLGHSGRPAPRLDLMPAGRAN